MMGPVATRLRTLALIAGVGAGGLILYAVTDSARQIDTPPAAAIVNDADYWITGLALNAFNANGARHYRLHAADMTHARSADQHRLTRPQLEVYDGPSLTLRVNADTGRLPVSGDHIELLGNALIERPALQHRPAVTLHTTRLTVMPRRGHVETDRPVTIHSADSTLNATGLLGEFHLQRLRLQSRVTGQYQPAIH